MRIRSCDCKLSTKINRIEPNSFTFGGKRIGDKLELTTDFRTHNKYAKRLYYAFKPLWHLIHLWDTKFANEVIPSLNMGFDSLTAYPVPGTTVDGEVGEDGINDTWANLVGSAGNYYDDSSVSFQTTLIESSATTNQWRSLYRGIFLFKTSALTSSADISAAVLSLYGRVKTDDLSITPNVDIYTSAPASNTALANGDFDSLGSTSQTGSPITYADFSIYKYNAFTFNSTGRGNISKTGISKFGSRNANYDVANSAPSWRRSGSNTSKITAYSSNETGTTYDPKLVVTYTITVTTNSPFFGMNF